MDRIRNEPVFTIPNVLTMIRIALLPGVVWAFCMGDFTGALIFYLLAMLTDAFDGYIARRFNQITQLGKLLDPIADKLSLLTLMALFVMDGQIAWWVLAIVLAKEAALVIGSAIAFKRGIIVYALPIGKATTMAFILSMICRFARLRRTADVLLGVSVVMSLIALVWYTVVVLEKLKLQQA